MNNEAKIYLIGPQTMCSFHSSAIAARFKNQKYPVKLLMHSALDEVITVPAVLESANT